MLLIGFAIVFHLFLVVFYAFFQINVKCLVHSHVLISKIKNLRVYSCSGEGKNAIIWESLNLG